MDAVGESLKKLKTFAKKWEADPCSDPEKLRIILEKLAEVQIYNCMFREDLYVARTNAVKEVIRFYLSFSMCQVNMSVVQWCSRTKGEIPSD